MRFFSDIEFSQIKAARKAVDSKTATIVYATWENPFARGGGIIAVANNYGAELVRQGREVIMLSPYHTFLSTAPEIGVHVKQIGEGEVNYGGQAVPFTLYEHIDANRLRWVLIKAAPYFEGGAGQTCPYQPYEGLLGNAVFFCKVAPVALKTMELDRNIIFHLQDWQTSSISLTAKEALLSGELHSAATVLTMHNSYDCNLETEKLCLLSDHAPRTVYQWMMPLADGSVSTVSENFAKELISDPAQTGIFARHLQNWIKENPIVGVNNGLFGASTNPFPDNASEATLLESKGIKRELMLKTLAKFEDPRVIGHLDFEALLEKPDTPVFMMFGRLDPGQKGFDVLATAIEAVAERRVDARFILAPSAIDLDSPFADRPENRKQLEGLAQLGLLAHKLPGKVVIYPFRLESGYMEAMAGSSFAIFPSIYEPFGGATEPYLNGTPVIARRTGGLKQQVDHGETGFLYREEEADNYATRELEWREFQRADLGERARSPIFRNMVAALTDTLIEAGELFQKDQPKYAQMLSKLYPKACEFSWEKTATQYQAIYDQACS